MPDNRVIDQVSDEWAQQHPDEQTVLVLDRGMSLLRNRVCIIGNRQGYVAGLKIDGATRNLVFSIPNEAFSEDVPLPDDKEPLKAVRRASSTKRRRPIGRRWNWRPMRRDRGCLSPASR